MLRTNETPLKLRKPQMNLDSNLRKRNNDTSTNREPVKI